MSNSSNNISSTYSTTAVNTSHSSQASTIPSAPSTPPPLPPTSGLLTPPQPPLRSLTKNTARVKVVNDGITFRDWTNLVLTCFGVITGLVFGVWAIRSYNAAVAGNQYASESYNAALKANQYAAVSYNASIAGNNLAELSLQAAQDPSQLNVAEANAKLLLLLLCKEQTNSTVCRH